jgi:two-component system, response regulator YesN
MFNVIIADDEPIIRRSLKGKIDWNALGFHISGEASNGLEVLQLVDSAEPDIILTDMKMPLMDGIQLLTALSERTVKSKVIVISAYSSFNYTHAAVKCGAFDYILKPIDADELIEVLLRAKEAIESVRSQNSRKDTLPLPEGKLPALKDHFLNSFVTSGIIDETNMESHLANLGVSLSHQKYICIAIMIPELQKIVQHSFLNDYDKAFVCITNLIQSFSSSMGFSVSTFRNSLYMYNFYAIIGFDSDAMISLDMLERLKADIETFLISDVMIGVGQVCKSFHEINLSFTQALDALNYRNIVSESCIIYSDDIRQNGSIPISLSLEKEKAFLTSLEICNWEEMENNVLQLFEYVRSCKNMSFRQVYKLFSELLFLCDRILRKYDGSLEQIFNEDITSIDYIACKGSLPQLEYWFSQVITKIMKCILASKSKNMGKVIDEIKNYIDIHYFEDISLNDMSLKFYMNKSYLSALFKKRIGQNFVDYITTVRMKKASEHMKSKKCKVYEVAQLVGYTDERYFSKLFKKYMGVTPEEFKNTSKP